MKISESNLRALIREVIEEELEEISTSAGAGAYSTPFAFSRKGMDGRRKQIAQTAGYTLSPQSGEEGGKLDEGRSHYENYKADDTATPKQKLGRAIAEVNRALNEIDKVISMNARLKQETNTNSSGMWKRTMKYLTKMEGRMVSLSNKLREFRV
jgi:hypothetical protein